MTAGDLAAVLVSVLCLAAVAALVVTITLLTRTLRALRDALTALQDETLPLVDELRQTVEQAAGEVERVEHLVGTAEAISARVDGASRLATTALSKPVIKTVAVAAGTSRAAKRLRNRS